MKKSSTNTGVVPSRKVIVWSLSAVLYTVIFVHMTWPLLPRFGDAVVSGFRDADVFVWNIHMFTTLARSGLNPFHTDHICHPFGAGLVMHTYAPLTGAIDLLIGNPALTLNVVTMFNFVLSALGAQLLCRRLVTRTGFAFTCGFIFSFCPFKMTHLFAGQYNLIMTFPVPFYFHCLRNSMVPRPGMPGRFLVNRRFLLAGLVLLGIETASDYYLTYYLLLGTAGYFLYHRYAVQLSGRRRLLICSAAALAGGFLVTGALEIAGARQSGLYTSADLISYVVPSAYSRLFGTGWVRHLRCDVIKGGPLENITETGIVPLVLFLLFIFRGMRRGFAPHTGETLFLTLFFAAFAMPVVNIAGHAVGVLPTAVMHYIPFINNFRVASRMTIMVMLFLPVLGMSYLSDSLSASGRKIAGTAAAAAVFVSVYLQYLPSPFPLQDTGSIPAVYGKLPAHSGGALLELPFGIESGKDVDLGVVDTRQMVYQATHGKKVLGGYLSRLPSTLPGYYERYPFVMRLFRLMRTGVRDTLAATQEETAAFLGDFHIRDVIIAPGYERSAAGEFALRNLEPYMAERATIDGYTWLGLRPVAERQNHRDIVPVPGQRIRPARKTGLRNLVASSPRRLKRAPVQKLLAVRNALRQATDEGVPVLAPVLYENARSLLDSAQGEIAIEHDKLPFVRDFAKSAMLLDSALGLAGRARREGNQNRESRRQEMECSQ